MIVGGAGRCDAYVREDTPCKISLLAIDKWWADVKSRMVFHKNLSGTNCEKCVSDRKKQQEEVLYHASNEGDAGHHSGGAEIVKDFISDFETGRSAYEGIAGDHKESQGLECPVHRVRDKEEVPRGGSRGGARLQEDEDSRDSHVTGGLLWGDGADDGE